MNFQYFSGWIRGCRFHRWRKSMSCVIAIMMVWLMMRNNSALENLPVSSSDKVMYIHLLNKLILLKQQFHTLANSCHGVEKIRIHHGSEDGIEKSVPRITPTLYIGKSWERLPENLEFAEMRHGDFNITLTSRNDVRRACGLRAAVRFLSFPWADMGMWDI